MLEIVYNHQSVLEIIIEKYDFDRPLSELIHLNFVRYLEILIYLSLTLTVRLLVTLSTTVIMELLHFFCTLDFFCDTWRPNVQFEEDKYMN